MKPPCWHDVAPGRVDEGSDGSEVVQGPDDASDGNVDKGRGPPPPEVCADLLQDSVHVEMPGVRAAQSVKVAGVKYDEGKPPLHLLPFAALVAVSRVLGVGASRYGDFNWRAGLAHSRTLGAALRHIFAFLEGEDIDQDSGQSHLACASAELLFALTFELERRKGLDDRFRR